MNRDQHVNGEIQVPYTLDHDPAKETELLGSLIIAPEQFSTVVARLDPLDFSDELNAATFKGMAACHEAGLVPSVNRIVERLDRQLFERQNTTPLAFLLELFNRKDYPPNIPYLVQKVAATGQQRRLQLALHQARIDLDHSQAPADVLADLQEAFRLPSRGADAVDCGDLADGPITLDAPVFNGLLRIAEIMNLIMVTKVGKSWMAIYMAICAKLGLDLFGLFSVNPGNVLYVNAEIRQRTFEHRVKTVVEALGFTLADLRGLHVKHLKGKMVDLDRLLATLREYQPGKFSLVIFDPLSRLYPKGTNENDPSSIGEQYSKIDAFNDYHGCASIVVHHGTKGSQTAKGVTDVGSGSGMISRAADSHLIARAHEESDAVVVEAALRSFSKMQPFCLRWNFPLWRLDDDLDPAKLKPDRPARPKREDPKSELAKPWTAQRFVDEFVTKEQQSKDLIIAKAKAVGALTDRAAQSLLKDAAALELCYRHPQKDKRLLVYSTVKPTQQTIPEVTQTIS